MKISDNEDGWAVHMHLPVQSVQAVTKLKQLPSIEEKQLVFTVYGGQSEIQNKNPQTFILQ